MKILLLGGGNSQLNAIRRLKNQGHQVVISDYYPNPPGKSLADWHEQVSTFDVDGNIRVARYHRVDGIMTLGTDQPVYTVAKVAEALRLPALLDVSTARKVTHKGLMKQIFCAHDLPTVNYRLLTADFSDNDLAGLNFPVVVKPLDSQGQRGVYKLNSAVEVRRVFPEVLSYSRVMEILVEKFYPSVEITVSGWVVADRVYILAVVDRIPYPDPMHIGICIRHRFPSQHLPTRWPEIEVLTRKIVRDFGIHNGPIYFQMLIGAEGIKINEIACRIGGAYEDEYLWYGTGIDILGMLMDSSLGLPIDDAPLQNYDFTRVTRQISVELFFTRPGWVAAVSDLQGLQLLPGVIGANHHLKPGDMSQTVENATARAGYMIVAGEDRDELERHLKQAYQELAVYDGDGNNLVLHWD